MHASHIAATGGDVGLAIFILFVCLAAGVALWRARRLPGRKPGDKPDEF